MRLNVIDTRFYRIVEGKLECLKRTYIGKDHRKHTALYIETGASGNRWILDNESIVTIDPYIQAFAAKDPWDSVTILKDEWVLIKDKGGMYEAFDGIDILARHYGF